MSITIYSNDTSINWSAKDDERIAQNVLNIIRTRKFEVPFMREMGIDPDFIDAEYRDLKSGLSSHIADVIKVYEPRATVVDVRIESCDENGDYIIAVELEV